MSGDCSASTGAFNSAESKGGNMTFYDVSIYSSKLAGQGTGLDTLQAAMKAVDKYFPLGEVENAGWCTACKSNPFKPGSTSLYHVFMARETAILEMVQNGKYAWTKKRGMGRKTPEEGLSDMVANGTETWFQLELSEL
jgi:hypothetical protein